MVTNLYIFVWNQLCETIFLDLLIYRFAGTIQIIT